MSSFVPLPKEDFAKRQTLDVWATLVEAHRYLAELKGLCDNFESVKEIDAYWGEVDGK